MIHKIQKEIFLSNYLAQIIICKTKAQTDRTEGRRIAKNRRLRKQTHFQSL